MWELESQEVSTEEDAELWVFGDSGILLDCKIQLFISKFICPGVLWRLDAVENSNTLPPIQY